mmetsp:Transcript_22716/g.35561  ORF Transcript_22716/g.35561 Transcript_22716/m.35561 type:complete len:101 (-) Transcript_22716:1226-1528(-)
MYSSISILLSLLLPIPLNGKEFLLLFQRSLKSCDLEKEPVPLLLHIPLEFEPVVALYAPANEHQDSNPPRQCWCPKDGDEDAQPGSEDASGGSCLEERDK